MKKGVFIKYFVVFLLLVLSSALIFSSIFLYLASRYFKEDKYNLLYNNALQAREFTIHNYYSNMEQYIDKAYVSACFNVIGKSINADVFLSDMNGEIKICMENHGCKHNIHKVSHNILNEIKYKGIYKGQGTLDNLYDENYYIIGVPILLNNEKASGLIVVSTSAKNLNNLLLDIVKIFTISFIVVIVISMGIIWIVTNKMVAPLKQMAIATKTFAKGDFRNKININRCDEIGELSNSLNDMAESLGKIEISRRDFIANVSHDLRTPMTTILSFIEGILDGVIPKEKHEEYLIIVINEVKRLTCVINSMLNLTKIESGQMQLNKQEFDINEVICQIIFNFEDDIIKKSIQIYGLNEEKVMVYGDKDMMYQVLYNLIDNAVKFTDESGYIKIRYKATDELIFVGIKNSGEGININDINNIFDKFYKSDKSRNINKNGIGLGLHIVKHILNLHGSDIEVESNRGKYTEFFFGITKA